MFFLRRVSGQSMQPALKDGQIILFKKSQKPALKQIVCCQIRQKEVVKRLVFKTQTKAYLKGDNLDSGIYLVDLKDIKGVFLRKLF